MCRNIIILLIILIFIVLFAVYGTTGLSQSRWQMQDRTLMARNFLSLLSPLHGWTISTLFSVELWREWTWYRYGPYSIKHRLAVINFSISCLFILAISGHCYVAYCQLFIKSSSLSLLFTDLNLKSLNVKFVVANVGLLCFYPLFDDRWYTDMRYFRLLKVLNRWNIANDI